jgi:ABC-2 type transport system permease protein
VGNANLVKKVYFPREALVVSNVASWVYSLLIELGTMCIFFLIFGNMVVPWIPVVLGLILLQTIFVLGVALLLSALNVYFRDIQHLFGIVLLGWFYATPVVYPISLVIEADSKQPELLGHHIPLLTLYKLNPMTRLVGAYRNVLFDLRFPPMWDVLYIFECGVVMLAIGWYVFNRLEGRMAEEL